jgi:oligo-1,6-glucosidase
VHENYRGVNVEKENSEEDSLLNIIRVLNKIRANEKPLREGSLEILDGLPNGVLGYARKLENDKVVVLLNFSDQGKEFQIEATECVFKLSGQETLKEKAIQLNGFGGVMLKN